MNDFLSSYTGTKEGKKPSKIEVKQWKTDNSKTLIQGVRINVADVGIRTMRVLSKLTPETVTPKKNQQLRIRTQAELNMIGLVIALCQNRIADEVIISTYTLNDEALTTLCAMLDSGVIKKLYVMMASSIGFRSPEHKEKMIREARARARANFSLSFAYSHFKITLVRCGNQYYQAEGSMNYSRNNAAENLLVEENKKVYEFDRDFILGVMLNTGHKAVEIIC